MKKINYLVFNTKQNGGNMMVFEHASRLAKRGYDVVIYTVFGAYPRWIKLSVPIYPVYKIVGDIFFDRKAIWIASFWPTAYFLKIIRSDKKIYFVQGWEEEFSESKVLKFLVRVTFAMNFKILTISQYLVKKIARYHHKKALLVHCHGVNILRHKKTQTDKVRILAVVSTYSKIKGVDRLVEAVEELKKQHQNYRFTLVSSEKKPPSPVFDRFMSGLTQQKLAQIYAGSDILLATGRSEGFFLPGLEAMAAGCLLVTTNSGGVTEYARHGHNAIFIDSIADLVHKKVIDKIMFNAKLRKKLVSNGYRTAREWQWPKIIRHLEQALLK